MRLSTFIVKKKIQKKGYLSEKDTRKAHIQFILSAVYLDPR